MSNPRKLQRPEPPHPNDLLYLQIYRDETLTSMPLFGPFTKSPTNQALAVTFLAKECGENTHAATQLRRLVRAQGGHPFCCKNTTFWTDKDAHTVLFEYNTLKEQNKDIAALVNKFGVGGSGGDGDGKSEIYFLYRVQVHRDGLGEGIATPYSVTFRDLGQAKGYLRDCVEGREGFVEGTLVSFNMDGGALVGTRERVRGSEGVRVRVGEIRMFEVGLERRGEVSIVGLE